jgi:GT2 family glycosyltransferase
VRSVVAICTRNRPEELHRALQAVARDRPTIDVLVIDASNDQSSSELCKRIGNDMDLNVLYRRAPRPGLAKQRNFCLSLIGHSWDLVHFIDDDTEVCPGYLDAIERGFSDSEVVGVGGVVVNQPPVSHVRAKTLFCLYSDVAGRVLPSGRNTIGHYPEGQQGLRSVQWLAGCAMSYRVAAIGSVRFDERLEGYSWGEDFDFSFRLAARRDVLRVATDARCLHAVSALNRYSPGRLARQRTYLLHRWVQENQERGMRLRLFWWSLVGEVLLRGVDGLRSRESRAIAGGVLLGILDVGLGKAKPARRSPTGLDPKSW